MYTSLTVTAPPVVEPVTVDQARQHCRVDSDYDDLLLAGFVTAARSIAETYLNRSLITQTLQAVIAQRPAPPGMFPYVPSGPIFVLPLWFNWADISGMWIDLPRAPTQSVTSVYLGSWGQADTLLVQDVNYNVDLATQPGRIRSFGFGVGNQDHLKFNYVAGYGDTGAAVPAPILTAILWITAFLYENRGDTDATMPRAAEMMLAPYRLVTFG